MNSFNQLLDQLTRGLSDFKLELPPGKFQAEELKDVAQPAENILAAVQPPTGSSEAQHSYAGQLDTIFRAVARRRNRHVLITGQRGVSAPASRMPLSRNKNPKLESRNPKQIRSTKSQIAPRNNSEWFAFRIWNLGFSSRTTPCPGC